MRVLLDHCVPRPLGRMLVGHDARTTYRMGWADVDNGDLLDLAAADFDVFVAVDQNIQYQRNLGEPLPLPVVVLIAQTNQLDALAPLVPHLLALLSRGVERRVYEVGRPE